VDRVLVQPEPAPFQHRNAQPNHLRDPPHRARTRSLTPHRRCPACGGGSASPPLTRWPQVSARAACFSPSCPRPEWGWRCSRPTPTGETEASRPVRSRRVIHAHHSDATVELTHWRPRGPAPLSVVRRSGRISKFRCGTPRAFHPPPTSPSSHRTVRGSPISVSVATSVAGLAVHCYPGIRRPPDGGLPDTDQLILPASAPRPRRRPPAASPPARSTGWTRPDEPRCP
jgi:hypothetical protein